MENVKDGGIFSELAMLWTFYVMSRKGQENGFERCVTN